MRNELSLDEARAAFFGAAESGATCPCCDRYGQVYKRKLNSGMAKMLMKLFLVSRADRPLNGWVHFRRLVHESSDWGLEYSVLRFWQFVEAAPRVPGENSIGYWRVTALGVEFVTTDLRAPRHVVLYNNKLLRFSDEWTTFRQALGDHFLWPELMGAA